MSTALVLGLVACSRAGDAPAAAVVRISGAGATFPYPLYRAWFSEYGQQNNVQINYFSVGSREGLRLLSHGDVDFGATDRPFVAPPNPRTECSAVAVPMVSGDIAIAYHLPATGAAVLNFDVQTLAGIYSGAITHWNDKQLRALNPGIVLPAATIVVVHRGNGSGTGRAFSDWLATSGRWSAPSDTLGVQWPVGTAVEGNEGVAAEVKATQYSIGFMELAYARQNRLAVGAVRSAASTFVLPGAESANYPVQTRTWIVFAPGRLPADRGASVVAFIRWALASGSAQALALEYAPVSPDTVAHYDALLHGIRFGGCR